jgi:hypothetical protein
MIHPNSSSSRPIPCNTLLSLSSERCSFDAMLLYPFDAMLLYGYGIRLCTLILVFLVLLCSNRVNSRDRGLILFTHQEPSFSFLRIPSGAILLWTRGLYVPLYRCDELLFLPPSGETWTNDTECDVFGTRRHIWKCCIRQDQRRTVIFPNRTYFRKLASFDVEILCDFLNFALLCGSNRGGNSGCRGNSCCSEISRAGGIVSRYSIAIWTSMVRAHQRRSRLIASMGIQKHQIRSSN